MNIWKVEKQYYYNLAKIMFSLIFLEDCLYLERRHLFLKEVYF